MKYSTNGIGTVVKLHSKSCVVVSDVDGEKVTCQLRGRLFEKVSRETKPAAVGDRVSYHVTAQGAALEKILPRVNALHRPAVKKRGDLQIIAANIDRMIVVSSIKDPPLRTGLIDRFLVAAAVEEIGGVICLNKADLGENDSETAELLAATEALYTGLGYDVFTTSALTGSGVEALRETMRQGISIIVGHSGVGKSTLINRIDPQQSQRTGTIREKQRKGRHTTTSVSLLPLTGGGFVVDTPGIREFGINQLEVSDVGHFYPEMAKLLSGCQYHDCSHRHEPNCAVLAAKEAGEIAESRFASYLRILEEIEGRKTN